MRVSAAAAKWLLVLGGVVGLLGCFTSAATAGALATTNLALNDGFGPDAGRWHGSVTIDVDPVPVFGDEVEAVVDWAAFTPAKFQLYLNANHPGATAPATGPLEVIYAYEVISVAQASPGISSLTVSVDPSDGRGSVSPTFVPLTGGQVPSNSGDQTSSMLWSFGPGDALLTAGEKSTILVFSSPFGPELDSMQLSSGVASPNPSPLVASIGDRLFEFEVPEPMSSVLLVIGAATILAVRRSRN